MSSRLGQCPHDLVEIVHVFNGNRQQLSKIFQNSDPFLLKTQVTRQQNSGPMNKKLRSEFQKLRYSETKCLFLFEKSAQKKA